MRSQNQKQNPPTANIKHSKIGNFEEYTFFIADTKRIGAVIIAIRDNKAKVTNNSVISDQVLS